MAAVGPNNVFVGQLESDMLMKHQPAATNRIIPRKGIVRFNLNWVRADIGRRSKKPKSPKSSGARSVACVPLRQGTGRPGKEPPVGNSSLVFDLIAALGALLRDRFAKQ
jgi:hypothetical protein